MTKQTEQGAAPAGDKRQAALNDWFLALPEGHRKVLLDGDRWQLAGVAFEAGFAFANPTPEGCGWISVDDRLPAFAEDAEDEGVKVYTWDGELVGEDEFAPEYEQPAGPAVGGWMLILGRMVRQRQPEPRYALDGAPPSAATGRHLPPHTEGMT